MNDALMIEHDDYFDVTFAMTVKCYGCFVSVCEIPPAKELIDHQTKKTLHL